MTWSRKAEKRTGRADTPGHMPTSAARAISRTNQTNSTSLLCLIRTVVLSGAANDVFTRRRTFPWIAKVAFRRFALVSKHATNIAKRIHTTKDFSKKCVMGTPCLPENQLELGVFSYSQQAFQKHLTKTFGTLNCFKQNS